MPAGACLRRTIRPAVGQSAFLTVRVSGVPDERYKTRTLRSLVMQSQRPDSAVLVQLAKPSRDLLRLISADRRDGVRLRRFQWLANCRNYR